MSAPIEVYRVLALPGAKCANSWKTFTASCHGHTGANSGLMRVGSVAGLSSSGSVNSCAARSPLVAVFAPDMNTSRFVFGIQP